MRRRTIVDDRLGHERLRRILVGAANRDRPIPLDGRSSSHRPPPVANAFRRTVSGTPIISASVPPAGEVTNPSRYYSGWLALPWAPFRHLGAEHVGCPLV